MAYSTNLTKCRGLVLPRIVILLCTCSVFLCAWSAAQQPMDQGKRLSKCRLNFEAAHLQGSGFIVAVIYEEDVT